MDIDSVSLLKEEYFNLQKVIEDFDSKTITIKAWSITGSLAAIAAGLTEKGQPGIFIVGAIASLLFWIVEAYYKAYQLSYYKRIEEIEAFFSEPEKNKTAPLQTSNRWLDSYHKIYRGRIIYLMWWPAIMLPHIVILIGGIYLFCVNNHALKACGAVKLSLCHWCW